MAGGICRGRTHPLPTYFTYISYHSININNLHFPSLKYYLQTPTHPSYYHINFTNIIQIYLSSYIILYQQYIYIQILFIKILKKSYLFSQSKSYAFTCYSTWRSNEHIYLYLFLGFLIVLYRQTFSMLQPAYCGGGQGLEPCQGAEGC